MNHRVTNTGLGARGRGAARRAALVGWVVAVLGCVAGCGDGVDETLPEEVVCKPGETAFEKGVCHPAGLPPGMPACPPGESEAAEGGCRAAGLPGEMPACPPGEVESESGCQVAGIPAEACGAGFVADGDGGCEAVLPAACPAGEMAVPGESGCHAVKACPAGLFGDIPVEASTQFVSASYAGGDSDGSKERPWLEIGPAIAAAAPGAIVAVAAGTYTEGIVIAGKAVRLWGTCPGAVVIFPADGADAVQIAGAAAKGSEVRDLALRSAADGAVVSGATEVLFDRVWIHDTGSAQAAELNAGIYVQGEAGAGGEASVTVARSLVEGCAPYGGVAGGARLELDGSVVRGSKATVKDGAIGLVALRDAAHQRRGELVLDGVVVEANAAEGVYGSESGVTMRGSVIRGNPGWGLTLFGDDASLHRASAEVTSSVIDGSWQFGVLVVHADVTVDATVVRGTLPKLSQKVWAGIYQQLDTASEAGPALVVTRSMIRDNTSVGVRILGARARLEGTAIVDTLPNPNNQAEGFGVSVLSGEPPAQAAGVELVGCAITGNTNRGVVIEGGSLDMDTTAVADTRTSELLASGAPADPTSGRGIVIARHAATKLRSTASVRRSLVARNWDAGIAVFGSEVEIEATVLEGTRPTPGSTGVGLGLLASVASGTMERASVMVRASLVTGNRGIGVAVTGADLTMENTRVEKMLANESPDHARLGVGAAALTELVSQEAGNLTLRRCAVSESVGLALNVIGSTALIEGTAVVDTAPVEDASGGRGVQISADSALGMRSSVRIWGSLVARNRHAGVVVQGSDLVMEATEVLDTGVELSSGRFGRGVTVQRDLEAGLTSTLTVRDCHVARSHDSGIAVVGSSAVIERTLVEGTLAAGEAFGDGIVAAADAADAEAAGEAAAVTVTGSAVSANARVGVAVFGSTATLSETALTCNAFDLEKDDFGQVPPSISVAGEVVCGCPEAGGEDCATASIQQEPPQRIPTP